MAKSCNQKSKILYLERLFMESSEQSPLSMQAILSFLEEKEIRAERKSIYDDMETLRSFGMNILYRRGKQGGYYLAGGEIPEIPKLPDMDHKDMAPKVMEEQTLEAMEETEIPVQEQTCENIPENPLPFLIDHSRQDGRQVKLLFGRAVKEEVIKALGSEINYKEKGESGFTVTLQVEENGQFYGWLASFGKKVHILKPKKAAIAYREYLKSIIKDYKGIEK